MIADLRNSLSNRSLGVGVFLVRLVSIDTDGPRTPPRLFVTPGEDQVVLKLRLEVVGEGRSVKKLQGNDSSKGSRMERRMVRMTKWSGDDETNLDAFHLGPAQR
ncbi:hypothetical protein BC936DRAFT_147553 [Jimgerdemannia flammicorona]|uniref:Uncharacterized protein n=2 Tax=Jimgerdemannia flammicorona TaxID=994334 RepID=A0A433QFZ2_9FUNG|nr:hypothetical protein BC936DRAFT_147553 [Jimgerdemannia flammicorona]RUS28689.1 hypothetical protein BC938DRAFT_481567 [Jimgerdemannia flammicorona]